VLPNCDHESRAGCAGYVYADRRGLNGIYLVAWPDSDQGGSRQFPLDTDRGGDSE
jgi:hypothetical protein